MNICKCRPVYNNMFLTTTFAMFKYKLFLTKCSKYCHFIFNFQHLFQVLTVENVYVSFHSNSYLTSRQHDNLVTIFVKIFLSN